MKKKIIGEHGTQSDSLPKKRERIIPFICRDATGLAPQM